MVDSQKNNFLGILYKTWSDYLVEITMIEDIFIRMVGGLLPEHQLP